MQAAIELAGYTPSESDDLRSAIAKKKEKAVAKHHKKFVKGAVEHGIDQQVAEEIFDHWEKFAHYGFNKSHAADYGVIAVQTGYLKYHYPVEYMTALLSAWKNDTDKCANYVAECRNMGIEVLPPDVNFSGFDFGIEDRADHTAAIRFGLGAVKNVGQNPVELIMAARSGKPFADITDFVRRVDLRQVGKRPLECLIKVGALDSIGQRHSLLRAADQMISVSTSHFRAVEMGQLALFGVSADDGAFVQLAPSVADTPNEHLEWEKELLGLYVSAHPLTHYMNLINAEITHLSNSLDELQNGTRVIIGGLVKRIRPLITKNQKNMAFVTIEDNFGEMELVVFPSVWERSQHLIDINALLVVKGKLDQKANGISILADAIKRIESDDVPEQGDSRNQGPYYEQLLARYLPDISSLSAFAYPPSTDGEDYSEAEPEPLSESNGYSEPDWEDDAVNPFPPGLLDRPIIDEVEGLSEEPAAIQKEPGTPETEEPQQENAQIDVPRHDKASPSSPENGVEQVKFLERLVVTIHSCGELQKDMRRIKHIHGYLSSHPGQARFSFCIAEADHLYEIDFPNDSTDTSDDLLEGLVQIVGEDHVKIDRDQAYER